MNDTPASSALAQTLVGAGIVLLGVALGAGAISIPSEAGYGGVGPNFLPWVVAVVLAACGIFIVREARTGGFRNMDPPAGAQQAWWPGLAWVSAGLLANAALITTIGFILSCALCYLLAVQGLRRARGRPAQQPATLASTRSRAWRSPPRCSGCSPASWRSTCRASPAPAGSKGHEHGHPERPAARLRRRHHPANLLWALVGCALGTAVGVLPGIGPAVAVAMLLPITAKVDITSSMIFFSGIYYGAMYGGSTTSILLNTPGETASMVTAMEGNKMAKSGRAGAALATAAIGSFVAGTIATVIVTLFAPFVADFAVRLGPPEYFLLMVLAFTTVSAVLGKSTVRGMTALFVGLAVGLVGLDQISGQARYTFGVPELLDGIEIVLVAVGLFAVAEVLYFGIYEAATTRDAEPHEPGLHERRRLEALDPGLVAWHRHRHAFRLHPGRRHRDPDLPELRGREEAGQRARTVRSSAAPAPSREWPVPRRPTTPP
jgi:hypothetical protein